MSRLFETVCISAISKASELEVKDVVIAHLVEVRNVAKVEVAEVTKVAKVAEVSKVTEVIFGGGRSGSGLESNRRPCDMSNRLLSRCFDASSIAISSLHYISWIAFNAATACLTFARW